MAYETPYWPVWSPLPQLSACRTCYMPYQVQPVNSARQCHRRRRAPNHTMAIVVVVGLVASISSLMLLMIIEHVNRTPLAGESLPTENSDLGVEFSSKQHGTAAKSWLFPAQLAQRNYSQESASNLGDGHSVGNCTRTSSLCLRSSEALFVRSPPSIFTSSSACLTTL